MCDQQTIRTCEREEGKYQFSLRDRRVDRKQVRETVCVDSSFENFVWKEEQYLAEYIKEGSSPPLSFL
jgi:hypothetical protein